MKHRVIWSSESRYDESFRKEIQNWKRESLGDDSYEITDEDMDEEVYRELEDERQNLDLEVDGVIIVFSDLGLWYGRRQGYQILDNNISSILRSRCDDVEWYGDGYNIRGRMSHHDGTNYTLYRVAKNQEDAERIADMIYSCEIDEAGFRRRTRSLYPYVAEVYGWKTSRKSS